MVYPLPKPGTFLLLTIDWSLFIILSIKPCLKNLNNTRGFLNLQRKLLLLLALLTLFLLWLPVSTYAQSLDDEQLPVIDWQELNTENFIIVYANNIDGGAVDCPFCGVDKAQFYAAFIDDIYFDLAAVFGTELELPINLRLFPTEESYYEINPLAEQIPGLIAHALNNREEIAIALPRTESLPEEELKNNLRHELTHFFASLLSDGKLNTGFQEGTAQYLEKPTAMIQNNLPLLQSAYNEQKLLSWVELDESSEVFGASNISYPQTLSMVAFLVDRYGFATFIDFIKANAGAPGYRSALEAAYSIPADLLEAQWLEYLPQYFDSRWQVNSIYAYDLSRVTQLVDNGAYTDAEAELTEIVALLETTHQTDKLAQAQSLLDRARQGHAAGALADEARQALKTGDYALTISTANQAITTYEQLGYQQRVPELQVYIQRAEVGQNALQQLDYGAQLLQRLRFFEAERQIYEATTLLQSLDNQAGAKRGEELLVESTFRQSLLAYAMLVVGVILLLFTGIRRLVRQFSPNPLEAEYR